MGKDPVMPLWVADLITDPNVVVMNNEEFGVYMRLICHCWLAGSLPNDDLTLSKLSLTFRKWKKIGPRIMKLFTLTENNVYIHKRIEKEKKKIAEYKKKQSVKGKRGADKRWQRLWHGHSSGHVFEAQENDSRGHDPAIAQAWPGHSSPSLISPPPPSLSNNEISLTLNSSDEKKIRDIDISQYVKREGKPEEEPKPNWQMADLIAEVVNKHTDREKFANNHPDYPTFVNISKNHTEQEIHEALRNFQDAMQDVKAGKRERIKKPVAFFKSIISKTGEETTIEDVIL